MPDKVIADFTARANRHIKNAHRPASPEIFLTASLPLSGVSPAGLTTAALPCSPARASAGSDAKGNGAG